jgi:hypothetical protein
MQSQGMKETLQNIHHHKNSKSHSHEWEPENEAAKDLETQIRLGEHCPWNLKNLLKEN